MIVETEANGGQGPHLLLTDSGLGGLWVCAGIERNLRLSSPCRRARLTYFNAAPQARRGYNDLPDPDSRAALLDRALAAMEIFHPDRIVLACNTLSVLYERTLHARHAAARVTGIIEVGVQLFGEALAADPAAGLVLLGTRTTIESGVHRERLLGKGFAPGRIAAVSCHGLAAAVEGDPDGPAVERLLGECAAAVRGLQVPGERLYAGLACTHYAFIGERIRAALEQASGLPVRLLDPNRALADALVPPAAPDRGRAGAAPCEVAVQVVSRIPLEEAGRRAIAGRIAAVSALTARALQSYTCDPDLF